ncbi:hypothetical protein [Rhizobium tumorigenes]|uniref:Uncharacterized protein n=1 Tax=Rhizobium tumorigenes TaxID=2041385 RepID=A0AAF1KIW3_9HYPH|nr:hypothetical protein [Rhizobium tumorigenes]WFR96873.1 hypothetical protein PR017_07100 [Rhizobium tumorigenes]
MQTATSLIADRADSVRLKTASWREFNLAIAALRRAEADVRIATLDLRRRDFSDDVKVATRVQKKCVAAHAIHSVALTRLREARIDLEFARSALGAQNV